MKEEIYSKGKRGLVYLRDYKGEKIIVKKKNPESESPGRIEIEAEFLKKLNKYNIGPEFKFFKDGELGMEFIEGELIEDFLKKEDKKNVKKVIENILGQAYHMDKLGINKEEMHHPFKHVIVRGNDVIMIDFERCNYSESPKNVSQFVQYITSTKISNILGMKGIVIDKEKIIELVKEYKKDMSRTNFSKLLRFVDKSKLPY